MKVTILVRANRDRQAILSQCSEILSHLQEPVELELDDFEHKFYGILAKHTLEENPLNIPWVKYNRASKLILEFNVYEYADEESVEITLDNVKGGCMIRVKDDGIGIAPEEADKIWNRFYRVDASHSQVKGFGLGLFMVRWIVELHGGKIEVQSLPELGSIFSVYLPENPDKR